VILLDTHVVIWLAFDQERISKHARHAIDEARQQGRGLAISDITLLELAVLHRKARIRLNITLEAFLREVETRFIVLPMTGQACVRTLELPDSYPKGLADRVIAATALVEGIPLVTADRAIRQTKTVETIW
jgi:PIN domain nuclease of toxin-antitoxin system